MVENSKFDDIAKGEVVVTLDIMLARRKVKSKELAAYVGITEANLSQLKSGKVKGVRFETLARICEYLNCKPGDILDFEIEG
ncbi:MAG: helix-turn-helix transcriptional regulator [Hellea sp.]